MAENKKNKQDEGGNFPPVGGGRSIKTPKMNGYWLYVILAAVIIGFQFIDTQSAPVRSTWQETKSKMIDKGDVEKILFIINK